MYKVIRQTAVLTLHNKPPPASTVRDESETIARSLLKQKTEH